MSYSREIHSSKTYHFPWDAFEEFLSKEIYKKPVELLQDDFYYWHVRDIAKAEQDPEYDREDSEECLALISDVLGMKIDIVLVDEYSVYVLGN